MGSRIGYRFSKGSLDSPVKVVSPILRKQWASSIKDGTINTWKLLSGRESIGNGMYALRDDLDVGRAFATFVKSECEPPFHSIRTDTNCDISDNGLIEIDITTFDKWIIYHYDIDFTDGKIGKQTQIAEMNKDGFSWTVPTATLENLGEGLF